MRKILQIYIENAPAPDDKYDGFEFIENEFLPGGKRKDHHLYYMGSIIFGNVKIHTFKFGKETTKDMIVKGIDNLKSCFSYPIKYEIIPLDI